MLISVPTSTWFSDPHDSHAMMRVYAIGISLWQVSVRITPHYQLGNPCRVKSVFIAPIVHRVCPFSGSAWSIPANEELMITRHTRRLIETAVAAA